jgi:hypothetical protein
MKLAGVLSTAVLSLALGIAVPVFAQDHEQDEPKAKPAQDEKKAQPEKPAAQQEKNAKPAEKSAPGQHAAGNGNRIPADRYKANF